MDNGDFVEDASSRLGAQRIVDKLLGYWRGRGFAGITAGIVEVAPPATLQAWDPDRRLALRDRRPVFTVVSNIGPLGFPPREAPA